MHDHYLSWDKERCCWSRTIIAANGTTQDRAAEIGNLLMANNYIVRILDEDLRRKAIAGDFEDEHMRWILGRIAEPHNGWLTIQWARKEDFYKNARKIRGSKYLKKPHYSVVVPPESFDEILDFAGMYGFRISEKAQEIIDKAKIVREASMIVSVARKPAKEKTKKGPRLEVPACVGVADELKD